MKKILFFIALILTLIPLISGTVSGEPEEGVLNSIKINYIDVQLGGNGFVEVIEELIVQGISSNKTDNANSGAGIIIPGDIDWIQLIDSDGNLLRYNSSSTGNKQLIIPHIRELSVGDKFLLKYDTQHLTSKNANIWVLEFLSTTTPGHTIVRVKLPESMGIVSMEPRDLFWTPVEGSLWLYPQVRDFAFNCTYKYGRDLNETIFLNETTTTIPVTIPTDPNSDARYLLYAVILLLIAVIVFLIFYNSQINRKGDIEGKIGKTAQEDYDGETSVAIVGDIAVVDDTNKDDINAIGDGDEGDNGGNDLGKSNNAGKSNNPAKSNDNLNPGVEETGDEGQDEEEKYGVKSSIMKMLDTNERRVVDMLLDSDTEITQAYIYKTTGIPKASLSDIMRRLEQRNIIKRRREGRVNWITLRKWIFK